MPKAEVVIWKQLKNKQRLNQRFLRQYSVDNYILDFYCPALKLAIEIDGDSHFIFAKSKERDFKKEKDLERYGITVIRFMNNDIYDSLNSVVLTIDDIINNILKSKTPLSPPFG